MDFIFDPKFPFSEKFQAVLAIQLKKNPVYSSFANSFGITLNSAGSIDYSTLPLLPIRAFKDTKILNSDCDEETVFQSSATGSSLRSKHIVADLKLYAKAIETEFYHHFPKDQFSILAYTPGYNENPDSSLIWMLNHLINRDSSGMSRFLPVGEPLYHKNYKSITSSGRKLILFGAAFGLLDLIDSGSDPLPEQACIIETGGMKTYRREIGKEDLRKRLSDGFSIPETQIHSEYGMCELLSQCYAIGSESFKSPDWVYVSVRDPNAPQRECLAGEEGKIGFIDLANIYSCPFILTEDRGVKDAEGNFQVLGRWNDLDLRGCNFLIDRD